MSKLTRGEVRVTLDGSEHTLTPSLQAFSQLAARYDNHNALLGLLFATNIPAIITVLRLGLGWNDKQAKALPEMVFKTGAPTLVEPLSDYVFRLFNAGKSADEWLSEQNAGKGDSVAKEPADAEENPLLAGV